MIIYLKMMLEKLLGLINLWRILAYYIYKVANVIIIDKYEFFKIINLILYKTRAISKDQ